MARLNVLFLVLGTRGDVHSALCIGHVLKNEKGHRVRVASHSTFKSLVEDAGLEFRSIGGDGHHLAAYLIENNGCFPKWTTMKSGRLKEVCYMFPEMYEGMWSACVDTDFFRDPVPFVADIILATKASLAHIHCADRLGIPLVFVSQQPRCPTKEVPFFLSRRCKWNSAPRVGTYLSHVAWESM